ncbi:hypothetical protein SOVF_206590 [Spinacia oleracea]|nr:hypothetical protein SOVF_206590 [Spinacia oleracea]
MAAIAMDMEEASLGIIAYLDFRHTLQNQHQLIVQMENELNGMIQNYNEEQQNFHDEARAENPDVPEWRRSGHACTFLRNRILQMSNRLNEAQLDNAKAQLDNANLQEVRCLHYDQMLCSTLLEINSVEAANVAMELINLHNWNGFVWVTEDIPVEVRANINDVLGNIVNLIN